MEQIILQGLNVQEFKELIYETLDAKFKVLVQSSQVQSNSVKCNQSIYYSRSEVAKLLKISLHNFKRMVQTGHNTIVSYREKSAL